MEKEQAINDKGKGVMKTGWRNNNLIHNNFLAIALACIVSLPFAQDQHQFTTSKKRNHAGCYINSALTFQHTRGLNNSAVLPQHDIYYTLRGSSSLQIRTSKIVNRERIQNYNQQSVAKNYSGSSLPPFLNLSIPIACCKLVI